MGKCFSELVVDESPGRNSEDVIELLESPLLRLWHETEDHTESCHV